jgi:hypothetical protein
MLFHRSQESLITKMHIHTIVRAAFDPLHDPIQWCPIFPELWSQNSMTAEEAVGPDNDAPLPLRQISRMTGSIH